MSVSNRSVFFLVMLFFMGSANMLVAETPKLIDSLQRQVSASTGQQKLVLYGALIKNLRNVNPELGIEVSRNAIKLADSLKDMRGKALILNEQGVCFRKLNIFEEALKLHFEALKIFDQLNDSMGTAYSFANIGMVYYFFKDYENALDYHYRSLLIKKYLKDEAQIAYSQNSIGMVLVELGDYARALDYYLSAMAIQKRMNSQFELANVYANIGKVFVKLDRFDDGADYFDKARTIYNTEGAEYGHALVLNEMADLFLKKNQPAKALDMLKESELLAKKMGNLGILMYNYNLQQVIYARLKDFEKAHQYSLFLIAAKDSVFSQQRSKEMSEIRVRYETNRIDSENEILRLKVNEQSLRLRSVVMITIGSMLGLIVFFLILRFIKNRKTNLQLAKLNEQLEERVVERTTTLREEIANKERILFSLLQSEEKFRAISEASPMGIAVSNQDGLCVFTNNKLSKVSSISGNEFLQGTWLKSIYVDDRKQVETVWQDAHNKRLDAFEVVFRVRTAKNELRWIHLRAAAMVIDHRFVGMVSMMEDITERKVFENELIKAKNKAEESDKLKSAFLANMSHEIRTPMNAILGFSDLLSSSEYEADEKDEFLDMIKSSGRLLLNLINDIIDISKIEAGELKIQPVNFSPAMLLNELQLTFRNQLNGAGKSEIKLLVEMPVDFEKNIVFTDKLRLQQVLTNLLSNAVKFTHSGQIVMGVIQVEGFYEFYVKDSGIGIPPSKLEVVFERFRQADESHTRLYGGTGLGLAIVKNLVELLGGRIWADSIEGKGTAFYFTLPSDTVDGQASKSTSPVPKEQKKSVPDLSGKTILIAEDVDTNFQLIKTMLRQTNARLLHAPDGLIAVDMAVSDPHPDIILMDIQMPNMDGVEAMLKIRHQGISVPIIAITAFALQGEGKYYTEVGFDAYLSKPLSNEKLLETVKFFMT